MTPRKLLSVTALTLMLLVPGAKAEYSQVQVAANPARQPKLTIGFVQFNSLTPDGYYNATVGLNLDRGENNPTVSFNVAINHVKTLNDVYAQLKPEVDKLGDDIKKAAASFEPPSH